MSQQNSYDIFDQEINKLTKLYNNNKNAIYESWDSYQPLFETANVVDVSNIDNHPAIGCLTQIKYEEFTSGDPLIDEEIRNDENIPRPREIEPKHLKYFADWQRRLNSIRKSKGLEYKY